jgi:hypothetical protein
LAVLRDNTLDLIERGSPGLSLPKDFGPDTISRIAKLHANKLAEQSTQNIKHDDKKLTSEQTIDGVVHAHQRD